MVRDVTVVVVVVVVVIQANAQRDLELLSQRVLSVLIVGRDQRLGL